MPETNLKVLRDSELLPIYQNAAGKIGVSPSG